MLYDLSSGQYIHILIYNNIYLFVLCVTYIKNDDCIELFLKNKIIFLDLSFPLILQ